MTQFESHSIDEILQKRKILITCGTGGVGKTTLSAAIAFRAALLGKKALVITIDPAKRLATSLGVRSLGDEPLDLTAQLNNASLKSKRDEPLKGTLAAIIPDTRKTFEFFVDDLAPNQELAERVKKNPIFEIFAREFSGSNEYMALERLYSLVEKGQFDCIILDTPPSRNTLEFLNAPKLLARFFEERLVRWLVIPTNRLISAGMKKAIGLLEKLTGAGFMTSLFDFATALFQMEGRFTSNLNKIIQLLESDQVGFIMVTTPAPDTVPEALKFVETLREHRFHFDGLALNRTLGYLQSQEDVYIKEPAFEVLQTLQKREQTVLDSILRNHIPVCAKLPELARDVHSVEDLFHVAMAFGHLNSSES